MADERELHELREQVGRLTERVWRLERAAGLTAPVPPSPVPVTAQPADAEPVRPLGTAYDRAPTVALPREQDLESRIGSQWFNRVGIAAVLIGVSYFLKYAFENDWVGPLGRVTIGLLAGIAVLVWSERFRLRDFTGFALSLKAVGAGTLYLSLWAAFQLYRLVPSAVAFVAMIAVTATIGLLAVRQNSQLLAALALIGGFLTPVLISTGRNQQVTLFSYLLLLDLATLALVTFRPWRALLVLSFAATAMLYSGWYVTWYGRNPTFATTFGFATAFFAVFAIAPLFSRQLAPDATYLSRTYIVLPLLNAAVYFLQGYALMEDGREGWRAWFALLIAVVYLGLSRQVQKRDGVPDDAASRHALRLLYVAIAVVFIAIAIPLKLDSHWITLGWLAEAAVLLWLGYRLDTQFIKALGLGALALGISRLVMWDSFAPEPLRLLANMRFLSYVAAIAVLAFAARLAHRSRVFEERRLAAAAVIILNILALMALTLEAHDWFEPQVRALYVAQANAQVAQTAATELRHIDIVRGFTYSAIWMAYGAALMTVGFRRRSAFVRWQALALLALTTLKVFLVDTSELDRIYRIVAFMALGALLLAVSFAYQRDWLKLRADEPS